MQQDRKEFGFGERGELVYFFPFDFFFDSFLIVSFLFLFLFLSH